MTSKWYDEFELKIINGDITKEELKEAITNGFDINEKNDKGETLFVIASMMGETEALRVLKELNADINAQDNFGMTACMHAAWSGKTDTVRVLVNEFNVDVNAQDKDGKTACMHAAERGKTDTVRVLVEELKADVNAKDKDGRTTCMRAAENGKTDTVRVLVNELGADVNAKDKDGRTACMRAAEYGKTDTVRVLVEELKADVNAQDSDGWNACMWAASNGHTETLFELVRLGADISIENNDGVTLFDCIRDDETKEKVIKLRAEYEKDHSEAKKMAASFASRYFYNQFKDKLSKSEELTKEELQKAIDQGFDINEKDEDGHTLCMWASWIGKIETVRVLKKQGADVNAQDNFGWTACMYAAVWQRTETLFELVKMGADISIKDIGKENLFDHIANVDPTDNDTKKQVIRLRKEYEEANPGKPKMADDLAKMYLPKVTVTRVNTPKNGSDILNAGVRAANDQGHPIV